MTQSDGKRLPDKTLPATGAFRLAEYFMFVGMSTIENISGEEVSLQPGQRILAGVSGGVDSMVMVHLLLRKGIRPVVAHANFALRGDESDADEAFVRAFARENGLEFHTKRFHTAGYASLKGISIQMAARKLRYFWFETLAARIDCAYIAIGSNLNDNIETFLFNAVKGTGLSGLRGMKPVRGRIVRPLIGMSREEILTYARAHDINWREDSSNADSKYHRNRIRNEVIPALKKINPSLEKTFRRTLHGLQRLDDFVLSEIGHITANWITNKRYETRIDKTAWAAHPYKDVLAQYLLKPYGFNALQAADIARALNGSSGKKFHSEGHTLIIDREAVFIIPKRFDIEKGAAIITEFLGTLDSPLKLQFEDLHANDARPVFSNAHAWLDFEKLTFPLKLRKWQEGDRFVPFGMKGSKKISDFLIDIKVPLHEKDNTWVLESGGRICWVVGHRIDDRFRITPSTKRIYHITLSGEPETKK